MEDKKVKKNGGAPTVLKRCSLPISNNGGEEVLKKALEDIGKKRQKIIIGGNNLDN